MTDYASLIAVLLAIYMLGAGRRYGHLSAISLFVYSQAIMAVGTLPLLTPDENADELHLSLIISTFAIVIITATICAAAFPPRSIRSYSPRVDYEFPRVPTWVWISLSLAITGLYYFNVGYIALFDSFQSVFSGTKEDLAGLRLASYSGAKYLFPGYVNQFKNSLLPALALVVLLAAFHKRQRSRYVLLFILAPLVLVALLGTGQRGAFVLAGVIFVIFASLVSPRRSKRYVFIAIIVVLPFFLLSTLAGGRAGDQIAATANTEDAIGILLSQFSSRIFGSNQLSSVVGFRYIHEHPISFGSEWAQALTGILPGQRGSDISNRIFEQLYGSTRGTAPLSLWGSVYYNFGFVGTLFFAALITIALCVISRQITRKDSVNLIQAAGMAGVSVTLGMWIADGPTTLLNTGIGVYILLWLWGNRRARRVSEIDVGDTPLAPDKPGSRLNLPRSSARIYPSGPTDTLEASP